MQRGQREVERGRYRAEKGRGEIKRERLREGGNERKRVIERD